MQKSDVGFNKTRYKAILSIVTDDSTNYVVSPGNNVFSFLLRSVYAVYISWFLFVLMLPLFVRFL